MSTRWILITLMLAQTANAQKITISTYRQQVSFRGLSAVSDQVVWVSGSSGTVGRTVDGGQSWQWLQVPGFEKADFRDIEAFDADQAVILSVSEPAYILKTTDGGKAWKLVYSDSTPGVFLDAMDFNRKGEGVVLGDPIQGEFYQLYSIDQGSHWQRIRKSTLPRLQEGEAFFAGSGTNIRFAATEQPYFVTGGTASRFFGQYDAIPLPFPASGSSGAFSIAISPVSDQRLVVCGGNFDRENDKDSVCFLSFDGGKNWQAPRNGPGGFRSCVVFTGAKTLLACGPGGIDGSKDGGQSWESLSREGFHVVDAAPGGKFAFLAGAGGRVGRVKIR